MIRSLLRKVLLKPAEPEQTFMAQNGRYAGYQIGDWSYGRPTVFSNGSGVKLSIGKFCSIADGVSFMLDTEHRADWVTTYPFNAFFPAAERFPGHPSSKGDIVVGNDVWIGFNALILSGVTIGNGAVIGADSVVTKNVLPYAVVAGNPARQVRFRFSAAIIEALQEIAWWDWPLPKIKEAWPLLLSADVERFVDKYFPQAP